MSIRLGRDSEPHAGGDAPVGGARTAYGRSLEEATARLAKVAVSPNVPLTHVVRPSCLPEASPRAHAVRDAQVRSISIDFNAPTSLSVRQRPTATASIFAEGDAPEPRLARPASTVAASLEARARAQCVTEAKPPAPPGMPRGVWNADPEVVRGKTAAEELPVSDEFSITDYLGTWWYTPGDDDYRIEYKAVFDPETGRPEPTGTPTRVETRAPIVDIRTAWNWFGDTTYIEGGNYVPPTIFYERHLSAPKRTANSTKKEDLMGPLERTFSMELTDYDYTERSQYEYAESTIDVVTPRKPFKGIHAVMTEYMMAEWQAYLYDEVPEVQNQHRFHIMFDAWAARVRDDVEEAGMYLPVYGGRARARVPDGDKPFARDYADFFKDLTIVIQDRISSLMEWIVSYFLKAPLDSSPILAAAQVYRYGFWIDYARTKNTNYIYGPLATEPAPRSQARYAEWTTLPEQSPLWDGDPDQFVSGGGASSKDAMEQAAVKQDAMEMEYTKRYVRRAKRESAEETDSEDEEDEEGVNEDGPDQRVSAVGSPSPATLHEFLFGVVLNRWMPWMLERVAGEVVTACPGSPVDCMAPLGMRAVKPLNPWEEPLFCEWTRAFCDASSANRALWSLTRNDLRFPKSDAGIAGRTALRTAIVFA